MKTLKTLERLIKTVIASKSKNSNVGCVNICYKDESSVYMIATDGRWLSKQTVESPSLSKLCEDCEFNVLADRDNLNKLKLLSTSVNNGTVPEFSFIENRFLGVSARATKVELCLSSCEYPNIDFLYNGAHRHIKISVDANVLSLLLKSLEQSKKQNTLTFTIDEDSDLSPILIEDSNSMNFIAPVKATKR